MGDRTITIDICPMCGKKYEIYDAPSSIMYVAICDNCSYEDPHYYTEIERKLSKLERKFTKEEYTYDIELKKHTKEEMREGYEKSGKSKEWISRALNVDYSTKVRMVDILELKDKLAKKKKYMLELEDVMQIVKDCEVK